MNTLDYMATHPVFTTAEIQSITPSKETAETSLRRAVSSGKIERIRRGLYSSRLGVFKDRAPSPYDVVNVADPDAILSYRSALHAHGLAHNVSFDTAFRSSKVKSAFEYKGTRYTPYSMEPNIKAQMIRRGDNSFSRVTTREQTFVDCLSHPGRAGGSEEVIRALSRIPYLDLQLLERSLEGSSASVRARAGWLLEKNKDKWDVPEEFLDRMERSLKGSVVRFGSQRDPNVTWAKRWKLFLPFDEEEISEWID